MGVGSVWSRWRGRWRTWDADVAQSALAAFEARTGLGRGESVVSVGTADDVARAVAPRGRPVVVHHWATWCAPCLEELDTLRVLIDGVYAAADVVLVNWDRLDTTEPDVGNTRETVRAVVQQAGLGVPTWVVDDAPRALFSALRLGSHTVPQTHVIDADGGLLKAYERALSEADVRAIVTLLTT